MECIRIKQGDAYALPLRILVDGQDVAAEDVQVVEFMVGRYIRKTWPEEATYEDGRFLLPLGQKETFALKAGEELPLDVRVKFKGDDVIGTTTACTVRVIDAQSTEEL